MLYTSLTYSLSIDYMKTMLDNFVRMDKDRDGYVTEKDLATALGLPAADMHLSSLFTALNPVNEYTFISCTVACMIFMYHTMTNEAF